MATSRDVAPNAGPCLLTADEQILHALAELSSRAALRHRS